MRLFIEDEIRHATEVEAEQVLNLNIFKQQISLWKPTSNGNGFYFAKDVPFHYLVKHIANPVLLNPQLKDTVDKVIAGQAQKSELFAFCVATFHPDGDGKIRRLKHSYRTFTKLVQLDLDLKNEPNCTTAYVEEVLRDIYELTDLGKHILLSGKSISGKGLYLYLLCDTDEHNVLEVVIAKVYELLQRVFNFKNPVKTLDASVTDITNRLRYYAPDADLVINPEVTALDTSGIRVRKKVYSNQNVSQVSDNFRELEIIRESQNKYLSGYSRTVYMTGFHNAFLSFANSCIAKGISRQALEAYAQKEFKNLYNKEKRTCYLTEIMRVIGCAEKNILKK
ncbi:hypothetical protein [Rufibacter sp. XAAS-G3-1]|uniref:hypothetical protein n=1 Tax=Rufibacter sp. XAAS-G3-1 TaxID=2729134 RepID=UPI0015E660FF|nr:hypothetical protein [Rufibacter sp. XAAS-G3-1]